MHGPAKSGAVPNFCLPREGVFSPNNTDEHHDDSYHQKKMNESPDGIRGDKTEEPENEE